MLFEFSIAWKYLIPRRKQFSASLIALLSILVISLIVWLVLVFFSVTNGLEKRWKDKLLATHAPITLTPTDKYYYSYYYLVDSISAASDYQSKTLAEKLQTPLGDPHDANIDVEVPYYWPAPEKDHTGDLKDIVKETFAIIKSLKNVSEIYTEDYERALSNLSLNVIRPLKDDAGNVLGSQKTILTLLSFLQSINQYPPLTKNLISPSEADLEALLNQLEALADEDPLTDGEEANLGLTAQLVRILANCSISHLKTPEGGWPIPESLLPAKYALQVCVIKNGEKIERIIVPQDKTALSNLYHKLKAKHNQVLIGVLERFDGIRRLKTADQQILNSSSSTPLVLEGEVLLPVTLKEDLLLNVKTVKQLPFEVKFKIQNYTCSGLVYYEKLKIGKATLQVAFEKMPELTPPWFFLVKDQKSQKLCLPTFFKETVGVILPKTFRSNAVLLGDQGYLSYHTTTTNGIQEQRLPVYAAGFYDPGIIPTGGRSLLVDRAITMTVLNSVLNSLDQFSDNSLGNGINVWFKEIDKTTEVKQMLQAELHKKGLGDYWKVEAYDENELTREFLNQLKSEKLIFSLIAVIIILVACSNIISMLILLINDKKKEIGILRSMGASTANIVLIFGTCGFLVGLIANTLGLLGALVTLKNIQAIIHLLSFIQGHQAFNPDIFGDTLPSELSYNALFFVSASTITLALISGLIPAIKASLVQPSKVLRSE